MNERDNEKATAKILLSTDEAVVEKIRRVLTDHPEIVYGVMKRYEEQLQLQQREAEYQRALQQATLRQQQRQGQWQTYATDNTYPPFDPLDPRSRWK